MLFDKLAFSNYNIANTLLEITMNLDQKSTILVTCTPGLMPFLQAEIEQLGYSVTSTHETGVELSAALADAMLLNLHLRTALNVMFLLKEFGCRSPEDLYVNTFALPWEDIVPADGYLTVVSRVDTPAINNTMFPSLKVKDAIVDRLLQQTGKRPDSGPDRHRLVFQLFWKNDRAWLYLNTSGRKISDRGYRKMPHKAPLRESLAAGIILAAGYDGRQSFVAPMCGSGTLPIEAALLAQQRPPGLLRPSFGFMYLKDFDEARWQTLRSQARKLSQKAAVPARIIASDIDPQAITAAKKNAATAGVEHLIEFYTCDFTDTPIPRQPGLIILNPEYGQRLGEIAQLEVTYKRIGDFFKQRCPGYTGYIFTGNPDLAKKVGLRTSRKIPFFNADIECRLLKYDLYPGTKKSAPAAGEE